MHYCRLRSEKREIELATNAYCFSVGVLIFQPFDNEAEQTMVNKEVKEEGKVIEELDTNRCWFDRFFSGRRAATAEEGILKW